MIHPTSYLITAARLLEADSIAEYEYLYTFYVFLVIKCPRAPLVRVDK